MESVPYGGPEGRNAMGIQVAFCNAIALDLAAVERLIWVSGQIAFGDDNVYSPDRPLLR